MLWWSRHGYSEDMHYEDPYQNLYIDFKKGPTHLDGDRALELVRYRGYTDADIGRIRYRKAFLKALIKKAGAFGHNQNTGPV